MLTSSRSSSLTFVAFTGCRSFSICARRTVRTIRTPDMPPAALTRRLMRTLCRSTSCVECCSVN